MKIQKILRKIYPLAFWLAVWFAAYLATGQELLVPSPASVLKRFAFVTEATFWHCVGMSLFRAAVAYGLGVLLACVLAPICHRWHWVDDLIRPALTVVRATPVASFIILALVWLSSSNVPILTGVLMVTPVVFANLKEGMDAVDPQLLEMAHVFGWSPWKTFCKVTVPSVRSTFLSACESCVGLCFKASIAAEVIGTPKNAIGTQLYSAKIYLETDALMAWTLVVILLSMALEWLLRRIIRGGERRGHRASACPKILRGEASHS